MQNTKDPADTSDSIDIPEFKILEVRDLNGNPTTINNLQNAIDNSQDIIDEKQIYRLPGIHIDPEEFDRAIAEALQDEQDEQSGPNQQSEQYEQDPDDRREMEELIRKTCGEDYLNKIKAGMKKNINEDEVFERLNEQIWKKSEEKKGHSNEPSLPSTINSQKEDEIVVIITNKHRSEEKEEAYKILSSINTKQSYVAIQTIELTISEIIHKLNNIPSIDIFKLIFDAPIIDVLENTAVSSLTNQINIWYHFCQQKNITQAFLEIYSQENIEKLGDIEELPSEVSVAILDELYYLAGPENHYFRYLFKYDCPV